VRNSKLGCIVLCALAATAGCGVPSADWNGTWKLDAPKSTFLEHAITTISISADGEYHYYDGLVSHRFRCDGVYRPMPNNRTQACVKRSATTLDSIRMENGVKTNTYHWELSADRETFTATATALGPGGPVIMGQRVQTRISGSNDFAGEWKDTSFNYPPAELILSLDRQFLHISYPKLGNSVDAPLNGTDAAVHGLLAPEGMTYSVRLVGPREISILKKRDGEPVNRGSFKLSDDGKIVTESWWTPDRLGEKSTYVYERK
jgi:hypothetical protein